MHSKSEKQNFLLPAIKSKGLNLSLKKQAFFTQPKMTKILYSPACSPDRSKNKMKMISAFMENKSYQQYVDDHKQQQIACFLRDTQISSLKHKEEVHSRSSLIGVDAHLRYYQNYKNLGKIVGKKKLSTEENKFNKDPSTVLLQATQKMGILPCSVGLIKHKGDSTQLSIKGQKFGDKYISAVADALKQAPMIERLKLSNNRITDIGFNALSNSIGFSIVKLDLSFNKITSINQKFLGIILQPQARLQQINLQGNLISDKSGQSLCRMASYSKTLKYLNIRKNLLTKKCSTSISQILTRSSCFQELYIGMNRINDEGAIQILKALESNKNLKVFDYSMNKLGDQKNSCAKILGNTLANNKELIHVDFSENNFNEEQSLIIGEGLQKNHRIYGFHFTGNYGFIDSKGFYQAQQRQATTLHSLFCPTINSYQIVFRRQTQNFDPKKFKNVCWICQGWHEQIFRFNIPQAASDGKNLVYIHFDFEEYSPRLININGLQVKYKTMVPPKKYKYFFTWNHQQFTQLQSPKISQKPNQKNKQCVKDYKLDIPLYYTYELYNEPTQLKVQVVSGRSGKPKKIVNDWNQLIVDVLPRHIGLISKKDKKPWSYKDSLWAKQWKLQDQQMTKNCFQKDWKNSKLMNFIKNQTEQDKIKSILYSYYKIIKQLYRHYSSWSPFNGDIWAVSNNAFTQFCNFSKIISKDTPLKIIDLTFITTNSMSGSDWKGNSLVPQRGLIRFQFMESLVRLAEQKFKKNGYSQTILGSVEMMIKDHLDPIKTNPICLSEKWRLQKYFIQQNDILIRKYRPIFNELYKKNSKMKVKPGNKAFMCLAQFKSIFQRIGIAGNMVLERDMFIAFNSSMMTQIDEIQNQRFIRMSQIQFIEAVARCAYILPNNCFIEDIFESQTPFHAKFQWLIHQIKKICSEDIKQKFPQSASLFKNDEI